MKPASIFQLTTGILVILLNIHRIQSSPIPQKNRDEYNSEDESVENIAETTTYKCPQFVDDTAPNSVASPPPNIDEQISSTPVSADNFPTPTIQHESTPQSMIAIPPSEFQSTTLYEEPQNTTPFSQSDTTDDYDNHAGDANNEESDEDTIISNSAGDSNPSISDEFKFPTISRSDGRSLNQDEDDGFNVWATLRLNEVRMNLNNHVSQNNDYFAQIIAKFGRIDKTIHEIKKSIEDFKTSTSNKFTETKNTIKEKETQNRQRLVQLNESIKGNKASINTNQSQAKQDRDSDKKDTQNMKTGLDSQIKKTNDKVRDHMDLIDARMRALEENKSNSNNPSFNLT